MGEQKRLDRPELREIKAILRDENNYEHGLDGSRSGIKISVVAKKFQDLIPDVHYNAIKLVEEAKKQEKERIFATLESYPLNQLQRFPTRLEIEQALGEK